LAEVVPTLYEWIGGIEPLNRLTTRFYDVEEHAPMPLWGWGEVKGPYIG
jgi:truncated hemoglobin YjbI